MPSSDHNLRTPERLAYWYLRLNGFLLLENFVVHPDRGTEQRTDADLLGVRFKHRRELMDSPMKDDEAVSDCETLCHVIIAEVKRGPCALNGPWTNPEDENMQRVLKAIGCFETAAIKAASKGLYDNGIYAEAQVTCRLFAFGNMKGHLPIPLVPQILFGDMIKFIHERFRKYQRQKSSVGSWPPDGRELKNLARIHDRITSFERAVRQYFNVPELPSEQTTSLEQVNRR
jgi:hypothetical protein